MEFFNNIKKIVLVIEYDGKRYHGFQWQKGVPTIQDELEKAIRKLTGENRRVVAACRTDTGVHARGQVTCFRTGSALSPQTFVSGLNHYLPDDISVKGAEAVTQRFNVMKDAMSREYRYRILNRRTPSPLARDFYFMVRPELNTGLMDEASNLLIGEHDFASFVTAWDREGDTIRHIYQAGVTRDGDEVTLQVVANAFLTHQIRNIMGALIRVGTGKITVKEFKKILEMKQLSLAGPTAPAHGLCLMKVIYADSSEFKYENLCA
ncbi:MAG: tRNA pseudouridine(38-40) synthase TruA [Dehalococcoidia bacterium]|nr:tRNA pseudouridine(38-40) synthase TruA [Dehalococcoidia bacterium]